MSHFLVVDDSLVDRQLAGRLLQEMGEADVKFAASGIEAIEQLEAQLPLAVITDLQMPEMGGLQLVEMMRQRWPSVPVILMTAHGSEEVAVQALLRGATDYVPKRNLATELVEAIQAILAITSADRPHQRLSHCLRYQEQHYELENDMLLLPPLVDGLQQSAIDFGLVDSSGALQLAKALTEAISNAICHGNLELGAEADPVKGSLPTDDVLAQRRARAPFSERRVFVRACYQPEQVRFLISDQGRGFDHAALPDVKKEPAHLRQSEGRGLVLVKLFMDEVSFNLHFRAFLPAASIDWYWRNRGSR